MPVLQLYASAVAATWLPSPLILLALSFPYSACRSFSFHVLMWEVFTGEKPKRGSLRPVKVPEECPQVGPPQGRASLFVAGSLGWLSLLGLLQFVTHSAALLPPGSTSCYQLCSFHGGQPLHPSQLTYSVQEALDLMQQCGSLDAAARPTAQQVLQRLAHMVEQHELPPPPSTGP